MVVGVNGVNGTSVPYLVEGLIKPELGYVIIQLLSSAVMIAR